MVPCEARGAGETAEEPAAVEAHVFRLAVHDPPGGHDPSSIGGRDGLVAEAHPEDGHRGREPPDELQADAGILGPSRPRRDDDCRRLHRRQLVDSEPVVAEDLDRRVGQLPKVLVQVVRKGIVVVDDHDHVPASIPSARASAPSFASVSSNSFSGTESYTTPAPAWRVTTSPCFSAQRMLMQESSDPSDSTCATTPA